MAGAALRLEVGLARGGIANQHFQLGGRTEGRIPLAAHGRRDAVDVLGERAGILRAHSDRRHRALAAQDDRCDQLAGLIVEYRIGAQQIGAALIAAAQIDAVARSAMDTEQSVTACDQRWITRRPLLCGKGWGRAPALRRPAASLRGQIDDYGKRE